MAAYLMGLNLKNVNNPPAQLDGLIKNLASKTGATCSSNVPGTTNLIANNGNL